jgi:hypothetical protein
VMELFGLALGIVGIAFAFETPRKKVLAWFRQDRQIRQDFRIVTSLDLTPTADEALVTGKGKAYALVWVVRNETTVPIQLDPGIVMRPADAKMMQVRLGMPEFTAERTILPNHKLTVLSLPLPPAEIDHLRHWVRESSSFGLQTGDGTVHWIEESQFVAFACGLQTIAKEYGLAETVPEGKLLEIRFEKK